MANRRCVGSSHSFHVVVAMLASGDFCTNDRAIINILCELANELRQKENKMCSSRSNSFTLQCQCHRHRFNVFLPFLFNFFASFLFSSFWFRSRSATPSSFPGTPPQHSQNNETIVSNNLNLLPSGAPMKSADFAPRNYSEFIRSLAAKYNNNPNE